MPTIRAPADPREMVRSIKICIGDEWTAMSFGRPIPRAEAMKRARQTLEALA